jgi:hypothetical protein
MFASKILPLKTLEVRDIVLVNVRGTSPQPHGTVIRNDQHAPVPGGGQ